MELKDLILSTLEELDEPNRSFGDTLQEHNEDSISEPEQIKVSYDEERMLEGIKERLLVLFEGFQAPNNNKLEAKVDLTLNFLEYLLATIESRLEKIKQIKE